MAVADDLHGFEYRFLFPDGRVRTFEIWLDETLGVRPEKYDVYPDWTRLEHCKCPVCPLEEKEHPQCPIAVNLIEVIEFFKDSLSVEKVDLEIAVPVRTYIRKKVPLSTGISGLVGIYMATSGCPILGRLKPMVRTHLPFATLKETVYRAVGMYLLGQYFRARRGLKPDWELRDLLGLYKDIHQVNRSFCDRLSAVCGEDANLNAIVRLNCFADNSAFAIEVKGLDDIEKSFDHFLGG